MGRHRITAPRYVLDRTCLPASGPRVSSGTVASALNARGIDCSPGFVTMVWNGRSRALTELGNAIREETARQVGKPAKEIWKEVQA